MQNDLDERMKRAWKALNEYGIYTIEEFNKAVKEQKPLNIGCMTVKPDVKQGA